jgi:hypothetical protein
VTDNRAAIEKELRRLLQHVVEICRPYANSKGHFHNALDVRTAIALAMTQLESAERLAQRLK